MLELKNGAHGLTPFALLVAGCWLSVASGVDDMPRKQLMVESRLAVGGWRLAEDLPPAPETADN
jgi:hypothetical protein